MAWNLNVAAKAGEMSRSPAHRKGNLLNTCMLLSPCARQRSGVSKTSTKRYESSLAVKPNPQTTREGSPNYCPSFQ
jgi:hypothetical protein